MSKRGNRGKTPPTGNTKPKRGDGSVGYRRPPKEHQFKKGQSGNPTGRRKGSKNEATIWREVLHKQIAIREGGRTRKVSVLEAMILKYVERALGDDIKAAAFVLNRHRLHEADGPSDADSFDQDDQEVLDAFIQRLEEDFNKRKE